MFSGEDSSGDPFNSRNQFAAWALSQTACSSSKDNVDWAALAQQWIQMKESCSISTYGIDNSSIPVAPPPPQISREYEEQGEAEMEVVKEDETFGQGQNSTDMVSYSNPPEWQPTWFQNQAQFCPSWNTWSANSNNMPLQMPQQQIQIPPPSINILKDNSHVSESLKTTENLSSNDMPMDAAKRKTLPAWIREGLEKMEKEKLKQLEKNRAIGEQEFKEQSSEKDIVEKRSLLFQNNSDKSEDEEELGNRYDRGDVIDSPNITTEEPIVVKSKEEKIEELMLVVRKSLTELLLEVTNEEILTIAQEAFRKNKAKASSVQVFRKSALTSITSKLGLGAYEDSESENSDDESNKSEQEADESYDSEEELKESIRARHDAFKLIAQKIEASCMTGEEKEYRRNMENNSPKKSGTNNGGGGSNINYDNDSGETHPEKKMNINGKRIKERTSRFSSIKDSKYKSFYPTTGSIGSSAASASTSSMATSSHNNEYDKRKGNHITKQNSQSTDSSSSSSSSSNSDSFDSDTSHSKHRKSKSSRDKSDKSKIRDRRRERSSARDRDRNRDRTRDRSRDRDRDSDRSRQRDRDSRKDRERTREKDSERHRERDQEKNKNGDRTSREKSKDHDSEKIRDRHRERSKERERTRERGRDHERDREKEKDRHAKKSRSNRKQGNGRDSDSDEYSSRRRHHTTSSHSKDDRSRSNTRSRSRSY